MPQKTFGSAIEFAVNTLQQNPGLDYQTVKELATAAGLNLPAILYGRARQQLGLPSLKAQPKPVAPTPAPAAPKAEVTDAVDTDTDPEDTPSAAASTTGPEPAAAEPTPPERVPYDPQIDMVAPKKSSSPAFDFALQVLRAEPNIEYRHLKARMDEKGFNFPPIVFGRAKAVLGLVPVKPRGSKKAAAAAKPVVPGAPMQLKQVESVAADSFARKLDEVRNIDQLVNIVRELDTERRRLRAILEQVIDTLDAALS